MLLFRGASPERHKAEVPAKVVAREVFGRVGRSRTDLGLT